MKKGLLIVFLLAALCRTIGSLAARKITIQLAASTNSGSIVEPGTACCGRACYRSFAFQNRSACLQNQKG